MQRVPLKEASGQLEALVAAALNGEAVYLITEDQRELQLTPQETTAPKKKREAGLLKGQIIVHEGFDDPIEDFEEYM